MTIDLSLAGLRVRLREQSGRPTEFWPAEAFRKFVVAPGGEADLDFEVRLVDELPEEPKGRLLHDGGAAHWRLFEAADGFVIESSHPTTGAPGNRAAVRADFSGGTIVSVRRGPWSPSFVLNPLVEVCLLTVLARSGALMLHAAGVDFEGRGLIFTGPSGAGKSTLSGMFVGRGALILNDERVVIRDAATAPVLFGTPWCGSNPEVNAARVPLRGLYFIGHGRENRLRPLSRAQAASLCLKQAFLPYWDAAGLARTLEGAERLFDRVPPVAYDFLNEPSAVERLLAEGIAAPAA